MRIDKSEAERTLIEFARLVASGEYKQERKETQERICNLVKEYSTASEAGDDETTLRLGKQLYKEFSLEHKFGIALLPVLEKFRDVNHYLEDVDGIRNQVSNIRELKENLAQCKEGLEVLVERHPEIISDD